MLEQLIQKRVLETLELIPKGYRSHPTVKEIIRCVLFNIIREEGWIPIPAYRTPRFPEGPVDIVGMDPADASIRVAFSSNPLVELSDVRSLERLDAERKYIVTFSNMERKVRETAFFLKPGIGHIHLYDSGS